VTGDAFPETDAELAKLKHQVGEPRQSGGQHARKWHLSPAAAKALHGISQPGANTTRVGSRSIANWF
jgi:hypothetical protein